MIGGSAQWLHEEVSDFRDRFVDVRFLPFSRGADGAGAVILPVAPLSAGNLSRLAGRRNLGPEHDRLEHAEWRVGANILQSRPH